MAKKQKQVGLEFAFFGALRNFYVENRRFIRSHYKDLSKKFLDFNDPKDNDAYLRIPQFEALEMYIFIKEYCNNAAVHRLFREWLERRDLFEKRGNVAARGGQTTLFETVTEEQFEGLYKQMQKNSRRYSNYIYALTMGTGKTILMATCIFYEFLLANKFPFDERYCHNALVFAPDKTVLHSLREIVEFDKSLVVPKEYVNWLDSHLKFHFLDEAGTTLNLLDRSKFNIVISNTQKIILKKQHKEKTATDALFGSEKETHERQPPAEPSVYDEISDLLAEEPEEEGELATNQRFEKLKRLSQLGIYVDEAHHAFGDPLAKDMGVKTSKTSLRLTIDELAASLERTGTKIVACFNYTGTPYIGDQVLPEVIYAYGLTEAIEKGLLKKVKRHGYTNPRSEEFVQLAIDNFIESVKEDGEFVRPEGVLPKIAFFAPTIEDLNSELRPAVEKAIAKHGFSAEKILVNVGDPKLTSNDEIREFNNLDKPTSEKQFILLVNKGREGWNCRSLFGVALFRKPKSRVFVLQATMRCLRSIGDKQYTGQIYLSDENLQILEDELQQNFRISGDDLENAGKDKETVEVRVVPPPVKIKIKRISSRFEMRDKPIEEGFALGLEQIDKDKYRLLHIEQQGLEEHRNAAFKKVEDLTAQRERRSFSEITLVAEIARYLNLRPLQVEEIVSQTKEGIEGILESVNEFNELLYDAVIPKIFDSRYELREFKSEDEHEIELVKPPPAGKDFYSVRAEPEKIVRNIDSQIAEFVSKSFHLDAYCFDSNPENVLFRDLLADERVKKIYFTGMLTHGQTDFYIQYIDPDSHTVKRYYPDFLVQLEDDSWLIVEVKGDNLIEASVVQAKAAYARQLAAASQMRYSIIKGTDAGAGNYEELLVRGI
ncbi:MAG TPA: DEAD/DEAH box helicase family protein [Pyrinomonadaceae bacterium]|nr:DEAD/DEAH box helicase family protein [Pyrinomonadaceae bacterium]